MKTNSLKINAPQVYCVEQDFQEAKELVDKLTQILKDADNSIEAFNLSIADKEAVKKAIDSIVVAEKEDTQIEKNDETKSIEEIEPENENVDLTNSSVEPKRTLQLLRKPTLISESELIEKLKATARNKEFVGMKYFVREVLGRLGYSFDSSYALINLLADKGKLEIYAVNNPMGLYDTTAVKLKE